jgi:hypothetical protein
MVGKTGDGSEKKFKADLDFNIGDSWAHDTSISGNAYH